MISSQENDENSPIPRIHNSSHTAGITDQVIADRNPEPINHTKPESLKETIKMEQNSLHNTRDNALQEAQTQIGGNIINSQEDDENSPIPRINNSPHTAGITDQVIADRNQEPINHTKPESPKETITMEQNSLDNTRDNALQIVQSKTKEYIINNQEGLNMEWWRFGGVFINQEQSGITDPVIVYPNHSIPYIVGVAKNMSFVDGLKDAAMYIVGVAKNMSFVDGLKDAAMSFVDGLKDAAMSFVDGRKDADMSFVDGRKDADMSFVDGRKDADMLVSELVKIMSFVDGRKDADMDIFELEKNISLLEKNFLELEREILKETTKTWQKILDNTCDNERNNAQTQIEEDIYDYQIDGKNYRHPEIYDCAQTSSEHKQINPIKLERPKEALTTEQNSLDNTSDNERNNIEGDIINQEQPEITDPVNAYQNPEPMSQSILSLLQRKYLELKSSVPEKDILELERFSREREKEIVKRNNNKNLERSFVDVRKDADMDIFELEEKIVVSPDVGTKIENRKYKFIKPINCMTDFHARSLQIRKIMEIERYNRDAVDAPVMYNRDAVDAPKMFGNPGAFVVIKLSKFSKTYELKAQLKAFVKNAVRTSKPVTIEMLRTAASLAGIEIEELFLRNSNSQPITSEDLTYVIYFPDDC